MHDVEGQSKHNLPHNSKSNRTSIHMPIQKIIFKKSVKTESYGGGQQS